MINKILVTLVALCLGSPMLLTACNTVQGVGQDMESAGRSLKNEANEHKHY